MTDLFDQLPAKPQAWARPWAVTALMARKALRLGAWYPVIDDDRPNGHVTLVIRNRNVRVPARLLEVQKMRPHRFTVVRLGSGDPNPHAGSRRDLGRMYAVCPASGHRVRVGLGQLQAVCAGCGYRGEVGWNETG
jgi:hypothetical protein